jgi:hypothetical protein
VWIVERLRPLRHDFRSFQLVAGHGDHLSPADGGNLTSPTPSIDLQHPVSLSNHFSLVGSRVELDGVRFR